MGLWQTGYAEHHEEHGLTGLDIPFEVRFECLSCQAQFPSEDLLRTHRFQVHPLQRPVFILQGVELGPQARRVTRPLRRTDLHLENCDRVILNGQEITLSELFHRLGEVRFDTCYIDLKKGTITSRFKLEFRISSEQDLDGIEREFVKLAHGRRLDLQAIDSFITACRPFGTAEGYCDGICQYLFGNLAKSRGQETHLRHDQYPAKFLLAQEALSPYDRPLASLICCLIGFHFNHFSEASAAGAGFRVGAVAERFRHRLRSGLPIGSNPSPSFPAAHPLEAWVADWDTERILRWASLSDDDLAAQAIEMEEYLNSPLTAFDKVKVQMLLIEAWAATGQVSKALTEVRTLSHLTEFGSWAESVKARLSEVRID